MGGKSSLWELYHDDGAKHKTNKTHTNAWCNGCLLAKMKEIEAAQTDEQPLPTPSIPNDVLSLLFYRYILYIVL